MELERRDLADLLPNLSGQMRLVMSDLYLAGAQLCPAEKREKDAALDAQAARLDRGFYRMLRLVNELSAVAWLDGKREFVLRDLDLVDLVSEEFACAESLAQFLGVEFSLRCAMSERICAVDRTAIQQVIYQLLSNALKYTPRGGHIVMELKKSGKNLLLSVEDNGKGVPEEEREKLFDCCFSERIPIPPQGLGLGLCLCRRIAESHGGQLLMEPVPTGGSRFTLVLPDRKCGKMELAQLGFDYAGGFNPSLMGLADVLPPEAFCLRNQ